MRGVRIDREKALRIGALIALAALGLSTLPGLLRTPEPPPVPPDVGFRPGEFTRAPAGPARSANGSRPKGRRGARPDARREGEKGGRSRDRAVSTRHPGRRSARDGDRGSKRTRTGRSEDADGDSVPASAPAAPAVSAPAPALPPPPAPVTPPSPARPPAPPPPPGDGSEEFAPR